ncbi:MAG TPA: cadmium resistance transporter [Mycobacterium sp.]|nr:cadmium resistance transporter [Mycobacterium sp.]
MGLETAGQAVGMFVVTNVDDIVVLALFFGRAQGNRSATLRVFVGQYLGFAAILAASVIGALGAQLLPESAIAYLGLLPLLLGVRAAWFAYRHRQEGDENTLDDHGGVGVMAVAAVTLANGGDNISVYVPVFAFAGYSGMVGYVAVFLVGVAVWCAVAWYVATRPAVAKVLARWNHIIMPVVLIAIGLVILIDGGAFGR